MDLWVEYNAGFDQVDIDTSNALLVRAYEKKVCLAAIELHLV